MTSPLSSTLIFLQYSTSNDLCVSTHLRDPNKLIRLWCHEVYRVFYDRLIDEKDRKKFFDMVKSKCQRYFKVRLKFDEFLRKSCRRGQVDLSKILFPHMLAGSSVVNDEHLRSLFFGDYMFPEADAKIYDEVVFTSGVAMVMTTVVIFMVMEWCYKY